MKTPILLMTTKIPCQFKRKADTSDRGGDRDTQEKCYLQGRTRNRPDSFKHALPREERWTFQMSLNLKNLNQNTEQIHLKIDCLNNAGALMKHCNSNPSFVLLSGPTTPQHQVQTTYASLDLQDVYYSVRIHPSFTKCFRFRLFEFVALSQGFCVSLCSLTKLLKPVFSHLWSLVFTILIYIDNSLLQGDTFTECQEAVSLALTCEVLDIVGFMIHPVKSVFKPSQTIEFLQFSNCHKPLNSYSFQTDTNH